MTANELFYNLRLAFATHDESTFASLCDRYVGIVLEDFEHWTTIPEHLGNNENQQNIWGGTLMKLAQYYEAAGNSKLIQLLAGNKTNNLLTRLRDRYIEAQGLFNNGKFVESLSALTQILDELSTVKGPFADKLACMANGLAGNNYLKLKNAQKAYEYIKCAYAQCRQMGDGPGITVYEQSMRLIEAYQAYCENKNCFLIEVRNNIVRAQKLSDHGNFDTSNTILYLLLQKMNASEDPQVKKYHSKVLGLIGFNCFRMKELDLAKSYTTSAIQVARTVYDRAGAYVYGENLKAIEKLKPDTINKQV